MIRWNQVTALFGGSFDPPHLGHREAVRGLFRIPGVRRVQVLPTARAPHKSVGTDAEHRVAMARLNFGPQPGDPYPAEVEIDLTEIERARREPGPTYSFETIQSLRARFGEAAFVIGTDQLKDLPSWNRFPALLEQCHWIVLTRKPDGERVAGEVLREWESSGLVRRIPSAAAGGLFTYEIRSSARRPAGHPAPVLQGVPTEAPALSSTAIREAIGRNGVPPEGALLASVSSYLKEHPLYGS